MKTIVSWNVNGLRAVLRKDNWKDVLALNPDILCIQETKAEPSQLTSETLEPKGYKAFFSSSQTKKGYSGVAIYTKVEPETVEYGMGIDRFDEEGRIVTAHFKSFSLCNVYFPNGGMGPERLKYKMDFYDAFLEYVERLRKKQSHIIFCGDVNTAHEEIDLARPKANEDNTGFLPEERAWMDMVIDTGYIDSFRYLHPTKKDAYSYWDLKTRARDRNVGWRIDYIFLTSNFMSKIKKAKMHTEVYGSDHCPISIQLGD